MRSTPLRVFTSSCVAISSRSSLLKKAAHADVKAFRVFAEHDKVDIFLSAIAQRSEAAIEQHAGPRVHIEVELESQSEQDVGGVDIGRDARIAHRAEQDCVEIAVEHLDGVRGQGRAVAEIAVGAPIEFGERELVAQRGRSSLQTPSQPRESLPFRCRRPE